MKIIIEIDTSGTGFDVTPTIELRRVLNTVPAKVAEIARRAAGCVCDAPEAADQLRGMFGNVVGYVKVVNPG